MLHPNGFIHRDAELVIWWSPAYNALAFLRRRNVNRSDTVALKREVLPGELPNVLILIVAV